ncbi:MAG TPA: cellulase family glycosylhydrolase [Chryseolinea sp.]|nr:cellulase family glycosylhydrolase [Chryseolinea sp.]
MRHNIFKTFYLTYFLLGVISLQSCRKVVIPVLAGTPFKVNGNFLTDPCGQQILLRGMNKMSVFDKQDIYGTQYFPEIAKTNANSVRIVWLATYDSTHQLAQLDSLIKNCMMQKMIPMVELHDATCKWFMLDEVVNFWIKPEVVSLVQKYQHALLVNIANEAGGQDINGVPEKITDQQFLQGYKDAITKMRSAGIHTPLIVDASDCGKNLDILISTGPTLMQHDPEHNVMFSLHTYWSKLAIQSAGQPTFIEDQLQKAVDANIPLLLGELCAYGGWPNSPIDTLICSPAGAVDYQTFLAEAASHNIGWMAWEWGPGNGFYDYDPDILCPQMDITTDGTYNSIVNVSANDVNAWGKEVVITSPHSLKNTSVKSNYLLNGFKCL